MPSQKEKNVKPKPFYKIIVEYDCGGGTLINRICLCWFPREQYFSFGWKAFIKEHTFWSGFEKIPLGDMLAACIFKDGYIMEAVDDEAGWRKISKAVIAWNGRRKHASNKTQRRMPIP